MRFRYEEYSPQNKRQYVIAVGLHELRAMEDAAYAVLAHAPRRTKEQQDFRTSLQSSLKGLREAIKESERLQDDGTRRSPYVGVDKEDV